MTNLSRRDFLRLSACSTLALAGSATLRPLLRPAFAAAPAGREFLMLCDTLEDYKPSPVGMSRSGPGFIKGFDVASGEVFSIDVPFFGHTVTQNQRRPEQVVSFAKWSVRGALVDVKSRSLLQTIEIPSDKMFFGHAAFSSDGSVLMTTEDTIHPSAGCLTLRNAANLQAIGTMPTYGLRPHECRMSPDGKVAIVANAGGAKISSSLVWIDFASGQLLRQIDLVDEQTGYSHVALSTDHWACVGGSSHFVHVDSNPANLIRFVSPQGDVLLPDLSADMQQRLHGEALSIAFLEPTDMVAITLPNADMVLVFNYKTQQLVEAVSITHPTGVIESLNPDDGKTAMLVTHKVTKNLFSVAAGLEVNPDRQIVSAQGGGNGSHLTRLYI
jgi:hypothetical protein